MTVASKQYAEPAAYEAKLEKVMARLGVEQYDYDWSRRECWIEFYYKGQLYRFDHSIDNARAHGINIQYGSDVFAQVVLSLEDLARMVERGIYDLSTWVAGMKYLPAAKPIKPCFAFLQFDQKPSKDELKSRYRDLVKVYHPDKGGTEEQFIKLHTAYEECLKEYEEATQ